MAVSGFMFPTIASSPATLNPAFLSLNYILGGFCNFLITLSY